MRRLQIFKYSLKNVHYCLIKLSASKFLRGMLTKRFIIFSTLKNWPKMISSLLSRGLHLEYNRRVISVKIHPDSVGFIFNLNNFSPSRLLNITEQLVRCRSFWVIRSALAVIFLYKQITIVNENRIRCHNLLPLL